MDAARMAFERGSVQRHGSMGLAGLIPKPAIARSAARTAKLAANKAAAAKGAPTAAPPPALASEGGKRIRRPRFFPDS